MRYILPPTGKYPVGKVVIRGDRIMAVEGVFDLAVSRSLNRAMGKRL